MKKIILLTIILIFGIISAAIFIIVRNENFLKKTTISPQEIRDRYGDLYLEARIERFQQKLPEKKDPDNSHRVKNINDAELLIFGDSYTVVRFGEDNFPNQLAKRLKKLSFVYDKDISAYKYRDPFSILKVNKYEKKKQKILLFEMVDRVIAPLYDPNFKPINPTRSSNNNTETSWGKMRRYFFKDYEKEYAYFFQNNYLTYKINNVVADVRFEFFGILPEKTPVYSDELSMLFHASSVESMDVKYSDETIEQLADTLSYLSRKLLDEYNIELVFMPIPNKFTIYHEKSSRKSEYDDFLPRMYDALKEKNVQFVDLYHPYKNSNEILFWQSETHWNNKGMKIAIDECEKVIRDLSEER